MFEQKNGQSVMKIEHSEKRHQVSVKVTGADIEAIVTKALNGGISTWAKLDSSQQSNWDKKPDWVSDSQFATQVLLEGGILRLEDVVDEICHHELTIGKLIKGIGSQVYAVLSDGRHSIQSIDRMLEEMDSATAGEIFMRAMHFRKE